MLEDGTAVKFNDSEVGMGEGLLEEGVILDRYISGTGWELWQWSSYMVEADEGCSVVAVLRVVVNGGGKRDD